MYTVDPDGNPILNFGREVINSMQSTEITMEVKGTMALKYDFQNMDAGYQVTRDSKTGKEVVKGYVRLKNPPEVVITSSKARVQEKNRERVQLTAFNNAEQELREEIETDIIKKAYEGDFYKKACEESKQALHDALVEILGVGIDREVEVDIDVPGGQNPRNIHIEGGR